MIRLVKRVWVPMVMVIVVAVGAFTVSRLHGIFGSRMYTPDAGNADAIVQFNPLYIGVWFLVYSFAMQRRAHTAP